MARQIKFGPGTAMKRMAEIEAKLTSISRSGNDGVSFQKREAAAEPLRRELAHLKSNMWGES